AEGDQRHHGQQRGVDEAHRTQRELALQDVAYQRVQVPQQEGGELPEPALALELAAPHQVVDSREKLLDHDASEPGSAGLYITASPTGDSCMASRYPERIVGLTDETTETLYALGEDARIVGIPGFPGHAPGARRKKPKVAAFASPKLDRILDPAPDLVRGLSALQADRAAELVRKGRAERVCSRRAVDGLPGMGPLRGRRIGPQAK